MLHSRLCVLILELYSHSIDFVIVNIANGVYQRAVVNVAITIDYPFYCMKQADDSSFYFW